MLKVLDVGFDLGVSLGFDVAFTFGFEHFGILPVGKLQKPIPYNKEQTAALCPIDMCNVMPVSSETCLAVSEKPIGVLKQSF